MSRKVRYWVVQEHLTDLLAVADQAGCRVIPEVVITDSVPEAVLPTQYKSPVDCDLESCQFYLLPGEFAVVEAFYEEMTTYEPGRSKLISDTSPVIEVSPCAVDSLQPVEGRLFFDQTPDDPRYSVTLKLFNKLKRYIVKNWSKTENGKFYVGRHTTQMCRSGKTQIKYGGKILRIASGT